MKCNILASLLLALAITGCGSDDTQDGAGGTGGGLECDANATTYVAFDPLNHAPQDARLTAFGEMLGLFATAQETPSEAAAIAGQMRDIYASTETNLQAKVQGRADVHFEGEAANVGPVIDGQFDVAFGMLAAATTEHEVKVAKQIFEKAGMYRFLYLSVMQELHEPSEKHYDEAFGYLGTGETNDEAGRRGLASLATKRDGNNGTTMASEIFQLIVEGKCTLAAALEAAGAAEIHVHDDEAYDALVHDMDHKLQTIFAYSIGHELFEIDALATDAEAAVIKLYEAEGFFQTVEPYLLASEDAAKVTFATEFRTALDAATALPLTDGSWVAGFGAAEFLADLETLYAIDVKE